MGPRAGPARFPPQFVVDRNEDADDYNDVNWVGLLSGTIGPQKPKLSLYASERDRALPKMRDRDVRIDREFDIDSHIFRAETLAVFQGGFQLAYRPPFLRRITQNQRIRLKGYEVHKLKQLRLGTGRKAGGSGYDCHVFFPNMPIAPSGTTHLNKRAQKDWIDLVILPALRTVCPVNVSAHHPKSFKEADLKAQVKLERFVTLGEGEERRHEGGAAMDIRYLVPEPYVENFWKEVLSRAHTVNGSSKLPPDAFRDPFLGISGHNLKLAFQRPTLNQSRAAFVDHLADAFRADKPEWIPKEDHWLDYGIEDSPAKGEEYGVTLLRKSHCLSHWVGQFVDPGAGSAKTSVSKYNWGLTRDAGSASVELRATNALRSGGGMAYHKAYNICKERSATPLKGFNLFDNNQLEALAYTQALIESWYRLGGASGASVKKRAQLLAAFRRAKKRFASTVETKTKQNIGVRQEYRLLYSVFLLINEPSQAALDLIDPADVSEPEPEPEPELTAVNSDGMHHRPYWRLLTRDVNDFVAAEVSRWLFAAEVLICRADAGYEGRAAASEGQQLMNGVMLAALLRTIRISTSGNPIPFPCIWNRRGKRKKPRRRRRHRGGSGDDEDDSEEGHDQARDTDASFYRGLDLRMSVNTFGMAWFPEDLMQLERDPMFRLEVLPELDLARTNALQQSFTRTKGIQRKLSRANRILEQFRNHAFDNRDEPDTVFRLATQLVVQLYIKEVFAVLAKRWVSQKDWPLTEQQEYDRGVQLLSFDDKRLHVFIEKLSIEARDGLAGLTPAIVKLLLGSNQARIIPVRQQGKQIHFRQYTQSGLWKDKLKGLFGWDDEAQGHKARGWHGQPFRTLARKLFSIIVDEFEGQLGRKAATPETIKQHYLEALGRHAASYLWIIPQYDFDHLSVLHKPSKHHANDTYAEIKNMNSLEKTNFILPYFNGDMFNNASPDHAHIMDEVLIGSRYKSYRPREPIEFKKSAALVELQIFLDGLGDPEADEATNTEAESSSAAE
jgi:hypothetical protein